MIYSKTSEYGIRALAYLALKPSGSFLTIREVSHKALVPRAYVAKIFQCLARAGVLRSYRGPTGGFYLSQDPARLTLLKVIEILDDKHRSPFSQCVMGLNQCVDTDPCPLHPIWKRAKEEMIEELSNTTILDIAKLKHRFKPGKRGRSTLSKQMKNVFSNGSK